MTKSQLPTGWEIARVSDVGIVGTGATPLRSKSSYYEGGSIPWVTSGAVNERIIRDALEFVTEKALRETNLTVYEPGTLVVAMYGEGKTRGKCAELAIAAATNQALAAIVLAEAAKPCARWIQIAFEYGYEETRRLASGGVQP